MLGARGIKNPHNKKCTLMPVPQKPCAHTSGCSPSSVLDVLWLSISPVSGCKLVSMDTLEHTSVKSLAVRSLMSLSDREQTTTGTLVGMLHGKVYSTYANYERAYKRVANHTAYKVHLERSLYAGQNFALQ